MNILIRNAEILTVSDGNEVQFGNVGITGDSIAFIGETPDEFLPDEIIEANGNLVMPGLVNAHTHIPMSLFRSYADDLPFFPWLTERIWPAEAKLRSEDVYVGSVLSIAEMIRFGVTTFSDMYFFMDDIARAVTDTGIRANISRGIVTIGESDEVALSKISEGFDTLDRYSGSADGRIRVDIAPHAPYTNPAKFIEEIVKRATDRNARIHIHLSESKEEFENSIRDFGKTPVEYVEGLGLLDLDVAAAHCVQLTDNDIEILAKNKVNVLHNPVSNLKLGNGAMRTIDIQKAGINIALGTDGSSSNNNQNLLEEAKLAAILAKGISGETTAIPAIDALRMATVNGAAALGRSSEIGTLEVGKRADIIVVNTKSPHWMPKFDIVSNLIYSGQAMDVETTIVNGKILMKDGVFTTIDIEKISRLACESAKYLTD
jgi:5-methylthioadenosine/S-adenosylhomocysteine deaminase